MPPESASGAGGTRFPERGSEAEALFLALVEGCDGDDGPEIEHLCAVRPDLASELRELLARFRRGNEALCELRDPSALATPETGDLVGRYSVRREIARGGMGTILEVWDSELRRTLAMKVLREPPDLAVVDRALFERRRSRLVNEAQILGQLAHPGIVPIHEVGTDAEGRPYLTMLRVEGRALGEVFEDVRTGAGGWSTTRAVGLLLRVCEAVAHAHSKGVIHRDLKPSNVMVGSFGEVFVMDWGLAKARGSSDAADIRLREAAFSTRGGAEHGDATPGPPSVHTERRDASESDPASPFLTMEGDVVGTPAYMSPEQASGRVDAIDERSDIYSLGAMLYHLLSSFPPYCDFDRTDGEDPPPLQHRDVLARVAAGPPPPLRVVAPTAPPELVAIAEKAMSRDPARRYPNTEALREDLRAHLEHRVVKAHRSGALIELGKWVQRHRLLVSMLALLILVLAGSAVGFGLLYGEAEGERKKAERRAKLLRQRVSVPAVRLDTVRSAPSFHDEFEDGVPSPRLRLWSHSELVEERDGRLFLEQRGPSSEETFLGLDPSSEVIRGDFDLSFAYEVEGFVVPPVGERWFGMNVRVAASRYLVAAVHRLNRRLDSEAGSSLEAYEAKCLEGGSSVYVPTTDRAGRLRISRRGARIAASFWRDGWQEIASARHTAEPLTFGLYCAATHGDDGAYTVAIDDLRLERLAERGRHIEPYVETFDGAWSSHFRPHEAEGVSGVVDGRAVLEKFEGTPGYAELELDWPTYFLRGNFEVSLDYEIETLPLPEPEDGVLRFRTSLWSLDDYTEHIGSIARSRDPAARWSDALVAWTGDEATDAASVQASGTSGRLRVRREGDRVFLDYWDSAWQRLLEREVHASDTILRFTLEGSREGAFVTIDDLHVAGLYVGG